MVLRKGAVYIAAVIIIFLMSLAPVGAQEEVFDGQITITKVETDQFPIIAVRFLATGSDGRHLSDLSSIVVEENGEEVDLIEAEPIDMGVSLVFLIDANETINDADEPEGLTRLEKVRDTIIRYANFYMDPLPNDEVTILVPNGIEGQPLEKPGMQYQNELINAINFYQPDKFDLPPLDRMFVQALQQFQSPEVDGRFQGVVFFTDGGQLADNLDIDSITQRAIDAGVPLFALLLGSRADEEEVAAVERLTLPTGGSYIHMPTVEDSDSLFELIEELSTQQQIRFRSGLNSGGEHILRISNGAAADETTFELEVSPPDIVMTVDNSRPIRRVGAEYNTPLELMEPFSQPLVAQVTWPDGYPRELVGARLLVDGSEAALDAPVLGDDGVLTFDWDLRQTAEGLYNIQIEVTDELGLVGVSDNFPLAVEIDIPPEPVPTVTAAAAPTEEPPAEAVIIQPPEVRDEFVLIGGGLFFLALFGLMALVFIVFFTRRSRGSRAAASAPLQQGGAVQNPGMTSRERGLSDPNVTYVIPPGFAISDQGKAYIEVLEHAPEHGTIVQLEGSNIALGRDPKVVQIPFNDRSVSRLHARIMENEGTYRIYDEGSSSGTYVNFDRIGLAPRILNDKDDLHLGRVHLKFHLTTESEDAAPARIPTSPSSYIEGDPDFDSQTEIYVEDQF